MSALSSTPDHPDRRKRLRIVLSTLALAVLGAIPGFTREHTFATFTSEDGLSQLHVTALVQDQEGYLWVGTRDGVDRFDGELFESFDGRDGLAGEIVKDLAVDPRGGVWVAAEGGITYLHRSEIRPFTVADGLPGSIAAAVAVGPDGTVWCGTDRGLARLRNGRFEHVAGDGAVGHLLFDPSGRLWLGTPEGIAYLDGERLEPFSVFGKREVSDLVMDREGRLWVAAPRAVEAYEGDRPVVRLTIEDGLPDLGWDGVSLAAGRRGELWIGSRERVVRYRDGETKIFGRGEGFALIDVSAVLEDREGVLWLGGLGGLSRFIGRAFTTYSTTDGLPYSNVRPILRDSRGRLWVGTSKGLAVLEGGRWRSFFEQDGLPSAYILALHEDAAGRLWVGTELGAVFLADGRFQEDPSFHWPGEVGGFAETLDGTLWAAVAGPGIVRRVEEGRFEALPVPDNTFTYPRLAIDDRQRVWVSGDRGVSRWNGETWTTFTSEHGLMEAAPYFLCADGRGGIWLGYHSSHGLTRFDGDKALHYTTDDGLTDNAVYSLGVDPRGYLWVGTARGVDRFDGTTFRNYGKKEGYASWESNAGGFFVDVDDTLWFGTAEGLSHYDPREDPTFEAPLGLALESLTFTLDGEAVAASSETVGAESSPRRLPEGTTLAARLAVVTAANRSQVDLRFRLRGFQREWQPLVDREILLPNLPVGEYFLEVQGRRYGEPWTSVTSPTFLVRPPFWRTPAFLLLAVAAVVLGTFGAVRARTLHLKRRNHLLEQEVARRSRESEEARRVAERANQAKSEFLAHMSHEIRTPLNAVIGLTSVLRRSKLEPRDLELVDAIEDGGRVLLSLVGNVLDFSRIEAGQVTLEREPFDLRSTVQGAMSLVSKDASERGLDLAARIADDVPDRVVGDSTRFRQILWNLLGNAIKFTQEGRVQLSVDRPDPGTDDLRIAVTDTGIGIPRERQEQIFDRFQQADDSTTRLYGGTGLGLTIVRQLVDLFGGTIELQSRPGEGSTFVVVLPLPEADALPESDERTPAPEAARGLEILVVDDNPINRLVAENVLEQLGHVPDSRENGLQAVEAVTARAYDLVLMDVHMPVLDGIGACKEIRKRLTPRRLPIVALTADTEESTHRRCLDAGMNGVLLKPIDPDQLQSLLDGLRQGSRPGLAASE